MIRKIDGKIISDITATRSVKKVNTDASGNESFGNSIQEMIDNSKLELDNTSLKYSLDGSKSTVNFSGSNGIEVIGSGNNLSISGKSIKDRLDALNLSGSLNNSIYSFKLNDGTQSSISIKTASLDLSKEGDNLVISANSLNNRVSAVEAALGTGGSPGAQSIIDRLDTLENESDSHESSIGEINSYLGSRSESDTSTVFDHLYTLDSTTSSHTGSIASINSTLSTINESITDLTTKKLNLSGGTLTGPVSTRSSITFDNGNSLLRITENTIHLAGKNIVEVDSSGNVAVYGAVFN